MKVDFPEPLPPTSARTSPAAMVKEKSTSAWVPPKDLLTLAATRAEGWLLTKHQLVPVAYGELPRDLPERFELLLVVRRHGIVVQAGALDIVPDQQLGRRAPVTGRNAPAPQRAGRGIRDHPAEEYIVLNRGHRLRAAALDRGQVTGVRLCSGVDDVIQPSRLHGIGQTGREWLVGGDHVLD